MEWLAVALVAVFLAVITCPYDADDFRALIARMVRRDR